MAARTPSRSTAASSAGALRGEPEPSRCEFSAATQLCEGFRAMMAAAAAAARARIAAPADASAHSSLVFDATTSASEALCSGLDLLGFVNESSLMKNTKFTRANSQRTQYKNVPTLDSINFFFNRPACLRRLLGTVGARVDGAEVGPVLPGLTVGPNVAPSRVGARDDGTEVGLGVTGPAVGSNV